MMVETAGAPAAMPVDTVDLLETNVDDVSGEVIGEALAQFMAAGARDASATPILMKKGRPGYLVTVIAPPASAASLARLMARELGTLGVRCIPAIHRFTAERTVSEVDVIIGGHKKRLPVKCGWMRREHILVQGGVRYRTRSRRKLVCRCVRCSAPHRTQRRRRPESAGNGTIRVADEG